MSAMREILVPITKPATEWVNGRALKKVSPRERHARSQGRLVAALTSWVDTTGFGRVGTEWEFRVTPPHEPTRPLVPDVAVLSYERLSYEQDDDAQIPYMAPNAAIEILSPQDDHRDVEEKIRVFLASGAQLVVIIDPLAQTLTAHDAEGSRTFSRGDTFSHKSLPDFSIKVSAIFEKPKPRGSG